MILFHNTQEKDIHELKHDNIITIRHYVLFIIFPKQATLVYPKDGSRYSWKQSNNTAHKKDIDFNFRVHHLTKTLRTLVSSHSISDRQFKFPHHNLLQIIIIFPEE
jgi:hypothetical protein